VTGDTTIDVQVFAGPPAASPGAAGGTITGVVYETTPNGRKPLRGAHAWLYISQGNYIASTETNTDGRFYFCAVNATVAMEVLADGYEPYSHFELVSGTVDRHFEFEFTR
jgi:hypothetical protein